MTTVNIGAGAPPHPEDVVTVDIRTDIDVDHPGVNIATDTWPFDNGSIEQVIANHVLEHIPPNQLNHVFNELDRVLAPGGTAHFEMPHAGSLAHATNPTHYGNGTTTDIVKKFSRSDLWSKFNWNVTATAEISWPTLIKPSQRITVTVQRADIGLFLCRLPFANGVVNIKIKKSSSVRS